MFVVTALLSDAIARAPVVLIAPCIMALFGYVIMKKTLWDLADEVFDCGDHLLVKIRDEQDAVPLSNVMNVSVATLMNPPRITLRLVTPGKFGSEICFSPIRPFTLNPFARSAIADDLVVRVDRARARRAA